MLTSPSNAKRLAALKEITDRVQALEREFRAVRSAAIARGMHDIAAAYEIVVDKIHHALYDPLENSEPEPTDEDKAVARNIVNQLGDLWAVPVVKRQNTNDEADEFVAKLVARNRRGEPTFRWSDE